MATIRFQIPQEIKIEVKSVTDKAEIEAKIKEVAARYPHPNKIEKKLKQHLSKGLHQVGTEEYSEQTGARSYHPKGDY